jgi:hypothetical protein
MLCLQPIIQSPDQKVVSEPAVNQSTRTLPKLRDKGASFLYFLAWLGLLQTEVAVANEPDEWYRGEVEIRKQVIQNGFATSSAPHDLVRGTFVSDLIKELSLSEKSALPEICISGITVEGEVRLTDLNVWSKIRFQACVFKGEVFLTNTVFRRGLTCHICTFENSASFEGVKVEGSAEFEYTKFDNSVTFTNASIGGDLRMAGSRFLHRADFWGLNVGSDMRLADANFFGDAFFQGSIGKSFSMTDTFFRGTAQVNFYRLKVGEDALVKAFFFGPVRWDYGEARGIYCKGSRFFDAFNFDSNKVSTSVSFEDCELARFICRANQINDDFDARGAHFKSRRFLSENQPVGSSEKQDNLETNFDVDFFGTKVGGILRFNGAIFNGSVSLARTEVRYLAIRGIQSCPELILTDTSVGEVLDDENSWPKQLFMNGFSYTKWRAIEPRGLEWIRDWLGKQRAYSPEPYNQLATYLRSVGLQDKSTDVLFASKERQNGIGSEFQKFCMTLSRVFIGYGYHYEYSVYWCLGFVILGTILLKVSHQDNQHDMKLGFFYSLDTFLPFVELRKKFGDADFRGWLMYYFYFHRLAGYVIGSFILAGLAGWK